MFEKISKIIFLWLPPILMCGVIFYLSSIPNLEMGGGTPEFIRRKIVHLLEYGFLAVLFLRAFDGNWELDWKKRLKDKKFITAVILATLYGASDEFHQSLVPTRDGKVLDFIIDGVGSLLGPLGLNSVIRFYQRIKK